MQLVPSRLRAPRVSTVGRRGQFRCRWYRSRHAPSVLRRWSWGLLCAACLSVAAPAADDFDDSSFNESLAAESSASARLEQQLHVDILSEGTSSRRLRRSAADELPLQRLTPEGRRLADSVLDQLSVHRRLPVVRCETDPRVLQFFLQHPDVAVGVWRAMDVSDMQLEKIGPHRYRSNCGDGSSGVMSVLIADHNQHLVHCQGLFKSPVLTRAIEASALMWLRMETQRDATGREFTQCTADVFVAFPSNTVETAARIVSPVSNRIADRNFHEVTMFVRMMHLAMTQQPGWVEQIAGSLRGVSPEGGQALVNTAAQVFVDAQKRGAIAPSNSLTPEGLRLPIRREPEASTAAGETPDSVEVRVATPPSVQVQR